jgi:hypothetical protein
MADPMTIMAVASAIGAGSSIQQGAQARSSAKRTAAQGRKAMEEEQQAQRQSEQQGEVAAQQAAQRQRRAGGAGGRQGTFLTGMGGTNTQQGQQRTLLGG